jgi:hypothetical protein
MHFFLFLGKATSTISRTLWMRSEDCCNRHFREWGEAMQLTPKIDLRGGRAVKGGRHALTGKPQVLSRPQSKGMGPLSHHLQSDIGVVQSPLDNVPRVASQEWWRWPALGRMGR